MSNGNNLQAKLAENGDLPPLEQAQTSGSITITPEMFERMYLGPPNQVKGDLRRVFGNPTPIGLGGFLMAYTPIVIDFMGWRGDTGNGSATVGTFYYFGGMLAIISCVMEWILGNSFPSTFFGVYGAFFFYYGATLTPYYGATAPFAKGAEDPGFLANEGFVAVFMALFSLWATICAIRINIIFLTVFALLTVTFSTYAAAVWYAAEGMMDTYQRYLIAAGAVGFPVAILGWYYLLVLMLTTVDFPVELPVGDLSRFTKSGTQVAKERERARKAANGNAA